MCLKQLPSLLGGRVTHLARLIALVPLSVLLASCGGGGADGGGGAAPPQVVPPPSLVSISVVPNPFSTGTGIARQVTASGTYSDGSVANVTASATWTTSAPSIATVTRGMVTGVTLGATDVTATIGSVAASEAVTVTTNTWSPAANMPAGRASHTATLLPSGKLLVTGGFGLAALNEVVASAEIYDPATDTWSPAASMSTPRVAHTATLLPSGKVLVTGGWQGESSVFFQTYSSAEIYDPATNTWSAAATMAYPRQYHTATLLPNDTVLVARGNAYGSTGGFPTTAEIYDPVGNTWLTALSMSNPHSSHTATLLPNGKVLVAGGGSASVETYDPSTSTWAAAATMATGRSSHTATLLPSGTLLVAGGADTNSTPISSVEGYDPVANTWSTAASMANARTNHTATLLPSGKLLVAGGTIPYPYGYLASAELYDPAANTWSPAASMTNARAEHAATLLPDGILLVTGGRNAASAYNGVPYCELYW